MCHLGVANDRRGRHQQAGDHGSRLGWCHLHPLHQNASAVLGTLGESSEAAVHHHQNASRRRDLQGVVFRSRPRQPLALVCMPHQWAVLRLRGCVSGNHMWGGRCLVMPGVKRRPIRWNQTGHHVLKGRDTTRISGLGTPSIGCCCLCCFGVALAALRPRVIAATDLDSTPKTLLTCRLPAASEDSTTHSGLARPKRGRDGLGGGVGHGVRRQPTEPNNTAGPRFRSQLQAASFMHHLRADHPPGTPFHWHAVDDPRAREGTGRHGDELRANLIIRDIHRQSPEHGEGDAIHGK